MNDTIDRQAVIDMITNHWSDFSNKKNYKVALACVDAVPPALPEPKKGKWIKISPANIYECSECGKSVMTNDICAYDFCHGCGAEMEVTT